MRHIVPLATGVVLLAAAGHAGAGPVSAAGISRADGGPPIILVQDKATKDETLKHKVKRVWRNLTGYRSTSRVLWPIDPAPKPARAATMRAANASLAIRCAGLPTLNSRENRNQSSCREPVHGNAVAHATNQPLVRPSAHRAASLIGCPGTRRMPTPAHRRAGDP